MPAGDVAEAGGALLAVKLPKFLTDTLAWQAEHPDLPAFVIERAYVRALDGLHLFKEPGGNPDPEKRARWDRVAAETLARQAEYGGQR